MGGGFVGACSAAAAADSGHEVMVYDINSDLIRALSSGDKDRIEAALFEQGLGEMIVRNQPRMLFTDSAKALADYINGTQAVFMCLPTPEKDESGETDLSYYEKAALDLAHILASRDQGRQSGYVLIINKSTVPIEMVGRTEEILRNEGVENFGVGSNPEFLVEGKAIEGSIRPSRVVVGANSELDFGLFRDIYKRFCDSPNVKYIEVNPREAAAGKLLANYILFNRLANCFDVVGRSCEMFDGMHFENVRKILISDKRIGDWGFYDSIYAGGSCFIKDARSLSFQLSKKSAATDLIDDTLEANRRQLDDFLDRPEKEMGFDWQGKKVALLGLAFKRDTNDIRNSASLIAAEFLLRKKVAAIRTFDPVAGGNYARYFSRYQDANLIEAAASETEAMRSADVLMIITDWPQFRELAGSIKTDFRGTLIMDGRRMLQAKYAELSQAGYDIVAVGSRTIRKVESSLS